MIKLIAAILLTASYFIVIRIISAAVYKVGGAKAVNIVRIKYIVKTLNMTLALVFFLMFILTMGIQYTQVSVFLSSAFAIIGVALFAQWSILSNITASLVIFFAFPYRVGDYVKVVDKDEDITGIIEEISLFHVIIRKDRDLITYPNSLILQKAVIKLHTPKPTSVSLEKATDKENPTQPEKVAICES